MPAHAEWGDEGRFRRPVRPRCGRVSLPGCLPANRAGPVPSSVSDHRREIVPPAGDGRVYDLDSAYAHRDLAEFSLFARAGTIIVDTRGEIDLSNADELTRAVEDAAVQGPVILDLTSVTFIDSTGVRAIFKLRRQLRDTGTLFCVVVPQGAPIRRVLTLLDLPSAVPVDDTLDRALHRMRAGAQPNGYTAPRPA